MFLIIEQCTEQNCGKKAYALAALANRGFHVPPFVVIGFDEVTLVMKVGEISDEDAARIQQVVGNGPYAVRSALSGEDSSTSSMAGQFVTVLPVDAKNLLSTIKEVIAENARRAPQMKQSIIIQRCLSPEKSGVVFTRSPFDPFCLQIDEVTGFGEGLVSGHRDADSTYLSRRRDAPLPSLAKIALEIESLFGHPQDIEWSIEKGELFILQARPITTLSTREATALERIEKSLPQVDYEFVQNGYTELAPNAEPFMVELLGSLFAPNGPVEKAYARLGMKGRVENPLTVIGDSVFCDSKKEQRLFQKGWRSIFNQIRHSSAKKCYKQTLLSLKEKITLFSAPTFLDIHEAQEFVLREYELVFAANIVASSLEASAQFGLKALTSGPSVTFKLTTDEQITPPTDLIGNSFSLYDQTVFHPRVFDIAGDGTTIRTVSEQYQYQAFQADVIREYGRWYAIQLMNVLRETVRVHQPKTLIAPQMKRDVMLPRRLSTASKRSYTDEMLSEGEAIGTLIQKESLNTVEEPILFVETLTPDLAEYLPAVKGIVTMVGSSLSHLAILARESRIPVLRLAKHHEGLIGKKVKISKGKLLPE